MSRAALSVEGSEEDMTAATGPLCSGDKGRGSGGVGFNPLGGKGRGSGAPLNLGFNPLGGKGRGSGAPLGFNPLDQSDQLDQLDHLDHWTIGPIGQQGTTPRPPANGLRWGTPTFLVAHCSRTGTHRQHRQRCACAVCLCRCMCACVC